MKVSAFSSPILVPARLSLLLSATRRTSPVPGSKTGSPGSSVGPAATVDCVEFGAGLDGAEISSVSDVQPASTATNATAMDTLNTALARLIPKTLHSREFEPGESAHSTFMPVFRRY